MSLGEQINLFATVLSNITELCGPAAAATLLSKSLFIVSSGSNDILEQQRSRAPLSPDFLDNLQSTYADHLRVSSFLFHFWLIGLGGICFFFFKKNLNRLKLVWILKTFKCLNPKDMFGS